MSKADRELSGNFANNRGKLPMPITGAYIITSHYGQYSVEGLRNVKLDNKGIDIQGKPGAQARAIFNGKVAAVFKLNGLFNILVRHGNYISVYCNLSSALVKQGDDVTTKQTLGQIFSDGADNGDIDYFSVGFYFFGFISDIRKTDDVILCRFDRIFPLFVCDRSFPAFFYRNICSDKGLIIFIGYCSRYGQRLSG